MYNRWIKFIPIVRLSVERWWQGLKGCAAACGGSLGLELYCR